MPEGEVPRFKVRMPSFRRFPARTGKIVPILLLVILPIIFLRGCFVTYLPPDRIGLRQVSFGPGKGLQKEVVEPGYRRQIRGYETVRTFPRNLQVMEFSESEADGAVNHRTMEAIKVPTVDGYPVRVDITVIYRIADPYLVVSKFGFGRAYEDSVVVRFTDPTVKQYLGELRAEEFYREERLSRVASLKAELSEIFAENGLELADILVRQYDYPDTFQALTEQKKIQDQAALANQALAKQAEVETRLKQVAAEGRNQISVRTAEFEAQITGINAQRDLYERQKRAEADLLVKAAEATGTEMINRAMEGAGSDKLLRLRKGLALLNGIRGPIYITGDPTDLGKLIR
jgi:regulator of protease activity HflC (stomatin/prohibitin superfamily)